MSNGDYLEMVEDCMNGDLTEWEGEFLDSLYVKLSDGESLTEQQVFKLEQIDEKVNGGWR